MQNGIYMYYYGTEIKWRVELALDSNVKYDD